MSLSGRFGRSHSPLAAAGAGDSYAAEGVASASGVWHALRGLALARGRLSRRSLGRRSDRRDATPTDWGDNRATAAFETSRERRKPGSDRHRSGGMARRPRDRSAGDPITRGHVTGSRTGKALTVIRAREQMRDFRCYNMRYCGRRSPLLLTPEPEIRQCGVSIAPCVAVRRACSGITLSDAS